MNENEELKKLYEVIDDEIYHIIKPINEKLDNPQRATNPLYLSIPKEYFKADIKLMVFGQETNGWNEEYEDDVDSLLDLYRDFFESKDCYKYGKQFWNGTKILLNRITENLNPKKTEYIWNNIVKMGKIEKGFPSEFYSSLIKPYLNEIIEKEVAILKPNFIIFLCGPNYDRIINDVFHNPVRKSIKNFSERELCEIVIPNVQFSCRTYHPGFLYRNNQIRPINDYFNAISDSIKSIANKGGSL